MPWVLGQLSSNALNLDLVWLYTSMTKSEFSLKWIGDPSGLLGLGQLTTVDYPVANYIRQGAPRTIWLTNDCGPHNRPLSEKKEKNVI